MENKLNRRYFIGVSLATASVTAKLALSSQLPKLFGAGAARTGHVGRVLAILMQQFSLTEAHYPIAAAFTASLLNGQRHSLSGGAFLELLHAKSGQSESAESLESYVAVQFILSTNYLEYAHGSASELQMLNVIVGKNQSLA